MIFGPLPPRPFGVLKSFFSRTISAAVPVCSLSPLPKSPPKAIIFVNHYISLWGCPTTVISDNGLQFTFKFSTSMYGLFGVNNVTTSLNHLETNDGNRCVNHAIVQMLEVSGNGRQNGWDIVLLHVEIAYRNSPSARLRTWFPMIFFRAFRFPLLTAPR